MKGKRPVNLTVVLAGLGVLLTAAVFWDLAREGLHRYPADPVWGLEGADVLRGKRAVERYGCGACHVIPGIRGARGRVGPKLEDFRNQIYIAGTLTNVPENLVRWIREPQAVNPGSAMPDLGVREEEARDMAAFLYAGD